MEYGKVCLLHAKKRDMQEENSLKLPQLNDEKRNDSQ